MMPDSRRPPLHTVEPLLITFRADADLMVRSRFALPRLAELSCGLEVLAHPERAPFARRWAEATRRRLRPGRIAGLFALIGHGGPYVPDFLCPVPRGYEPGLDEELERVAGASPAAVAAQLHRTFGDAPLPAPVGALLDRGGEAALAAAMAGQLRYCWQSGLDDTWPAVRRILDEDVRHHTARAGRTGFAGLVAGLHPKLDWDGARVTLHSEAELAIDDLADGLVLAPSAFLPRPAVWTGERTAMIGYPARGRGQVWAAPGPGAGESGLLGLRKAALLADLGVARSTTELARRHALSPATVSYHLGRLHGAGLVLRRQDGHSVLYERTPRAAAVLTALDG
jgi:DNA-binding transcriptional ArsR family regulator